MQSSRDDIELGVPVGNATQAPSIPPRQHTFSSGFSLRDEFDRGSIEVIDPYNPSISLQVQNRRRPTVNSVDELGPSLLPYDFDITRPMRSTFEYGLRPRPTFQRPTTQGRLSKEGMLDLGFDPAFRGQMEQIPSALHHEELPLPHQQSAEPAGVAGAFLNMESTSLRVSHRTSEPGTTDLRRGSISSRSVLSEYVRRSPFNVAKSLQPTENLRRMTTVAPNGTSIDSFIQPPPLAADLERGQQSLSSSMTSTPIVGAQSKDLPLRLYIATFLTIIIPQQIYLHLLLRLPYMYHSRVTQILLDANLTLEQMKELTLWDSADGQLEPTNFPRAYSRLKKNWESFIDNVLKEWKTLNIIAGLLLSGVVTIFQIDGASSDPITRYMAFWSLISALLSLMYGCFFIVRFSNMRRVYKATEWAIEAQKKQTMFWNVWVMLSMPAIWLVWSMIAYIVCIMSFMWRVRPEDPNAVILPQIGSKIDAAFRIFICCVLSVGFIYAILIINTLRHYGSKMDRMWSRRIKGYRRQQQATFVSPAEPPKTPTTRSPPINFAPIIPPTPPQGFSEPRLSSSPPAARTPPYSYTPPFPSPLAKAFELPRTPLDSNEIRSPYYAVTRTPRSPHRQFTIFSDSRQRLSPDPHRDSSPDSRRSIESRNTLPMQNDALGLFIPEELDASPLQRCSEEAELDANRAQPQEEVGDTRSQSPVSLSDATSSTLIQERRGRDGSWMVENHDNEYVRGTILSANLDDQNGRG
ncbi:hypothetical protein NP233_g4708 [Leucocoprinus birnbaumii]|uniref:Uncharacterized protein n=1 Tax=Leucocoprinus birnbaumii TaxID=56174 RepID=A0AAD5YXB7_9AGAR|nr:hypothetical protein NP233_g4708 [Leucocoprinus birnbaumii]